MRLWTRTVLSLWFVCLMSPLVWAQSTVVVRPVSTNITTNTTSGVISAPNGRKTFSAFVTCSAGACTQTLAIYGTHLPTATVAQAQLLCTITLSGTSTAYDACPVITAAFARYFVVTTATTGTGATGALYVSY